MFTLNSNVLTFCFVFMEGGASKLSECKRRMIMTYEVSNLELECNGGLKVITGG
jgi:hypothetical protein